MSQDHHEVLIVGGGSAGISVAARLLAEPTPPDVAIVEPATVHYYQPLWTLVGGGVFDRQASARPMASVMPSGATWIQDAVEAFDPANNAVTLSSGRTLTYDQLVVAPGIQLDFGKIEGLAGNVGKHGICSNYSYETVGSTWDNIRALKKGKAVFTFPATPIKCAGAPQKIMWLAEHHFERTGVRKDVEVHYFVPGGAIFGIPKYARALQKLADDRGVIMHFNKNLVAVRPDKREAVFAATDGKASETIAYDMIHVTPPQSAPDFVKRSPLANADGWVDVDMYTTQHVKYPNVFSLGDASSLPCSKTGAAIRKQAPVTAANLMAFRAGKKPAESYDGYASCPLVTGHGRLILAEFGYGGKIMETFPFDQAQERYSMYALKAYGLPQLYWHGMLKGRV
ncbi:MAG: NAD(P)/FAD-dependent oxidoreductase [Deltaproteobacteria bacterium]|nr:NAD(P)/FAD-dependent oxidoreductase [Deltaproteobacteria bacterium]